MSNEARDSGRGRKVGGGQEDEKGKVSRENVTNHDSHGVLEWYYGSRVLTVVDSFVRGKPGITVEIRGNV